MAFSQARKLVPAVNPAMTAKGENERLVRDLIDQVGGGEPESNQGMDRVQVPLDQRIERVGVPSLNGRHELGVVGRTVGDGRWRTHACLLTSL